MSEMYAAFQEAGGLQRELAQSVARPARFRYAVLVTGNGETRLAAGKGIKFGTAMLEEPSFAFGMQFVTPFALGEMPLCSAFVTSYVTDRRGLWIGADMGFRIESYALKPQVRFWLTFEATALRTADGLGS